MTLVYQVEIRETVNNSVTQTENSDSFEINDNGSEEFQN